MTDTRNKMGGLPHFIYNVEILKNIIYNVYCIGEFPMWGFVASYRASAGTKKTPTRVGGT